jgi:hypothetical protein
LLDRFFLSKEGTTVVRLVFAAVLVDCFVVFVAIFSVASGEIAPCATARRDSGATPARSRPGLEPGERRADPPGTASAIG